MHAYLIIGTDEEKLDKKTSQLASTLSSTTLEFTLSKIADIREISGYTKHKLANKHTIIIRGLDKASIEAQNAFLKSLEEPQSNLSFIVVAKSAESLLPTIISRCQLIKVSGGKITKKSSSKYRKFLKLTMGERLNKVDIIRKRDEAVLFLEGYINFLHRTIVNSSPNPNMIANHVKSAQKARKNIQANGNVRLQLSNFVITLS